MRKSNMTIDFKYDSTQYSGDGIYLNDDNGYKEILMIEGSVVLPILGDPTDSQLDLFQQMIMEFSPVLEEVSESVALIDSDTLIKAIAVAQDPSLAKDLL